MSVTSVLKPSNSKQELPITSPGKRKRIESALRLKTIRAAQTEAQSGSSSAVASTSKQTERDTLLHTKQLADSVPVTTTGLSSVAIWHWTLSRAAVAPCFVRDVYAMTESGHKDHDFFWLGRVPCRTVELVGMIVGVQVYEKNTVYSVDDGTGVLECRHPHPPPPPAPKPRSPRKPQRTTGSGSHDPLSAYRAPVHKPTSAPTRAAATLEPPPPPPPVAAVGQPVRLRGKVVPWHTSRRLLVDEIDPCASPNDESRHWLAVLQLHRDTYFNDAAGPFVIPAVPAAAAPVSAPAAPQTPTRARTMRIDPTYTSTTTASLASSAPSSPVRPSSPAPADGLAPVRPRLRHPTRLHTRDLTEVTFRIYLKHYMDNAPRLPSISGAERAGADASDADSDAGPSSPLQTPTKPRRPGGLGTSASASAQTPRARRSSPERTPRVSRAPARALHDAGASGEPAASAFTLSHLRRVPELALLAARIVRAEARRRAKAAQRAETGAASARVSSRGGASVHARTASATSASASARASEPVAAKAKRLFVVALISLRKDGLVVLWDGPRLPLPALADEAEAGTGLWKDASTASAASAVSHSMSASSSMFSLGRSASAADASSASVSLRALDEDVDAGALSDPPANEDAYALVTPALLAPVVERALSALAAQARPDHRGDYREGTSVEAMLRFVRRCDARWERVDVFAVRDALVELGTRDKVWEVGEDRWELCL